MIVIRCVRRCGWQRADALRRMKASAGKLGRLVRQSRYHGWKCWPGRVQSLLHFVKSQGCYFFSAWNHASVILSKGNKRRASVNKSLQKLCPDFQHIAVLPQQFFWEVALEQLWVFLKSTFLAGMGTSPHCASWRM